MTSSNPAGTKSWLVIEPEQFRLRLYIQPGAKKTIISGEHGDALKIRLAAPPVEGKANLALVAWLANCFAVPQRSVTLLNGEKSRHKQVLIHGAFTVAQVCERLGMSVSGQ